MKDKKRWRVWYENYKGPNVQAKFEELKAKIQNKTISKEEYAEYQKMQKIMGNLPKVDNLIEFIDKLEGELEAYKEEYTTRANKPNTISVENLEKEMNLNMKQQDDLITKRKEINKKIAATTDREEIARLESEKENINQDLSKLRFQADRNNKEFAKIKSEKPEIQQSNNKFSRYSDEQLKTRCFEISSMLSKCDMVATNLMKGLSIDSIQVKLEGWKDKKFTAKDPLPLTRKERGERQQPNQAIVHNSQEQENKLNGKENQQELLQIIHGTNSEPQPPVIVNDFEKAFPKLAKRFPNMKDNFLGKALLKVKEFFKPEQEEQEEQEEIGVNLQDLQQTQQLQQNDSTTEKKKQNELFRDYLKYDVLEVAQKGVEQVREERIAQKKEEVRKAKEAKESRDNQSR